MTVSVIIPAFNSAKLVLEAIHSAQAQTRPPLEIIVVDDASSDETAAIAERAGARVVRSVSNMGPASARNLGIAAAQGKFVAFIDTDDIWHPTHLAELAGLLDAHPSAAISFSRVEKFGDVNFTSPPYPLTGRPFDALGDLLFQNIVPQSTVVARIEAVRAVGGYRTGLRLSEDYDLWLRMAESSTFVASNLVTCRYRVHPGQASRALRSLIAASWSVRADASERLMMSDRMSRPHVSQRLRDAYENDLRWVWATGDPAAMRVLFKESHHVDGGDSIALWWRLRTRLLLPLRAAVRRAVRWVLGRSVDLRHD